MSKKMPDGFFAWLSAWDDPDLSDGAWQGVLMNGVECY